MSTLLHATFCAADHSSDDCCEAAPINIDGIGAVHILGDENGPVLYVEDETRGLVAEFGRYDIDEAEKVAFAMLEAVRVARSDETSAHADASCEMGVH